jgi:hypothetical protein
VYLKDKCFLLVKSKGFCRTAAYLTALLPITRATNDDQIARQSILENFKGDSEDTLEINSKKIGDMEAINLVSILKNTNVPYLI